MPVISANAYERGLHSDDNDLAIGSNDFFLKPVQVAELIDWIGRRLSLDWLESPTSLSAPGRCLSTWSIRRPR